NYVRGLHHLDERDPAEGRCPYDGVNATKFGDKRATCLKLAAPSDEHQDDAARHARLDKRQGSEIDVGSFDHPIMPQRAEQQHISVQSPFHLLRSDTMVLPVLLHVDQVNHRAVICYPKPLGIVETIAIGNEYMIGLSITECGQPVQRTILHRKCPQGSVLISDIRLVTGEITEDRMRRVTLDDVIRLKCKSKQVGGTQVRLNILLSQLVPSVRKCRRKIR